MNVGWQTYVTYAIAVAGLIPVIALSIVGPLMMLFGKKPDHAPE